MSATITFLGGADSVTGSKYLVEHQRQRLLVDCGLFQGYKQLRQRNWLPLPVDPADLEAAILTHAHIDHSGYLPLLVKQGFRGSIYSSAATRELCGLLLPDSGHLQEEEAKFANRHGFSKHHPALPLYTEEDAERCLGRFRAIPFHQRCEVLPGLTFSLMPSGHMLGSSFVQLEWAGRSMIFSGDIGRPNDLVLRPPEQLAGADYLIIESTYGDRQHEKADPLDKLADVINRTAARGGVVVIPAFAVGRAQHLMYSIHLLKARGAIHQIPVFLDSPMAGDVTRIYHRHRSEHRLSPEECDAMCHAATFVNSPDESKVLSARKGPMVIISASGMATGGRVVHHLKAFAPDRRNTILFAGYQAGGTRGAKILAGDPSIRIHGEDVPVRAEVARIDSLSAHADAGEILNWLKGFAPDRVPRTTFITHGEPAAADALRLRIETELNWRCHVPDYLETVSLN